MVQLNVEKREVSTRAQLKKLRSKGRIPAVVYGEHIESVPISVSEKEFTALIRSNPKAVLQMDVPDQGEHTVIVHSIHRDPVNRHILHVDFQQINLQDPIKTTVRLEFEGKPKGVEAGGILQTVLNEIEIECLPNHIPPYITVDVSHLEIGDSMYVSDIQVSDEIEILSDANSVIASVLAPQKPEGDQEEETASDDEESKEE